MKELIDFLQREFSDDAKEIQTDLQRIYDCLDKVHSEVDKRLPTIKGDYAKIGEYYAMGQELKQIKEKIKEICNLFPESESAGVINIPEESEIMPEKLPEVDIPEESLIDKDKEEEDEISAKGGRVNYANYRVDDTVPHFLSEDFTHKRPVAFEFDGTQYSVKDWKQFLLMICEIMYNKNHAQFESIVMEKDMQGKTRAYFSNNKEVYTAMYDGRKISNSNIYIETTHSANTICDIVSILFRKYRIPYAALQIYLKADYTPLHQAETESKPDNNRSVTMKIDSKSSTKSNPDDYRFIKDSYVQQSDSAMNGLSQRMGTPSHLEYLHMKENDTKRHKSRCTEYDNKKDICMCTDSANYLLKCGGSSHCKYYREEQKETEQDKEDLDQLEQQPLVVKKKQIIKILPKDAVKKCPICQEPTKQNAISVFYYYDNKRKNNSLAGYYCEKCKMTYISDVLYKMYTANKIEKNIDVIFVKA